MNNEINNETNTCCICLSDDMHLIHPKDCSCKVFLHDYCLVLCEKYGLKCPICRIKTFSPYLQFDGGVRDLEVEEIDRDPINNNYILVCPYRPRVFSGIIGGLCLGFLTYLAYSGNS